MLKTVEENPNLIPKKNEQREPAKTNPNSSQIEPKTAISTQHTHTRIPTPFIIEKTRHLRFTQPPFPR